jgi:hypothetical protein
MMMAGVSESESAAAAQAPGPAGTVLVWRRPGRTPAAFGSTELQVKLPVAQWRPGTTVTVTAAAAAAAHPTRSPSPGPSASQI